MVGSSVTAASKTRDTQEQSGSEQEEQKTSGSILHSLFGSDEPQTVAKFAEYDHGQSTALENMKDVSVEGKHTFLNFFGKMDGQENFVEEKFPHEIFRVFSEMRFLVKIKVSIFNFGFCRVCRKCLVI